MGSTILDNKRLCMCGCGQVVTSRNKGARFIFGHHCKLRVGPKHPNWIGGRYIDYNGYVILSGYQHHPRNRKGEIFEHIVVYEQYHKCCLLLAANVHHRNHNRADNRIENLQAMTRAQHSILHNTVDMAGRCCSQCRSDKTMIRSRDSRPNWYYNINRSGFLCRNCYKINQRRARRAASKALVSC